MCLLDTILICLHQQQAPMQMLHQARSADGGSTCCRSLPGTRPQKQSPATVLQSATIADTSSAKAVACGSGMQSDIQPAGLPQMMGDTPRSKAVRKLAALQVGSPAYTPSPIPLRRRLQSRTALQSDCVAQEMDDVICIDC